MQNQIDYEDHARMLLNPLIEGELRFGNAKAYGVEFMLKKNSGIFTGWVGYTLSRAFKKTPDINGGKEYAAFYDRPHDISIYMNYVVSERVNISTCWVYNTGSAITTPTGFYYYQGYSVPIYAEKNNDRLPDYHRLDIALNWRLNKKVRKFQHALTFSLYNAYGRQNPISINFNKAVFPDDKIRIPSNLYDYQDLQATQIAVIGFIPSIRYSFRFN